MENSGSNAYTYPYKLKRRPNKSNCNKIEKNMFYASKTHGVSYLQTETQLHTDCRTFNQILYIIHIHTNGYSLPVTYAHCTVW